MRYLIKLFLVLSLVVAAAGAPAAATPMRYVVPGSPPAAFDEGIAAVNSKLAADGVGIEVAVKYIGWDVWQQKLSLMLSSREPFELLHIFDFGAGRLASQGALAPLDDLLKQYGPGLLKMFKKEEWADVSVDGKIYAVPAIWRTVVGIGGIDGVIYARKDLLDKYGLNIPRDPEQFIQVAKALQAAVKRDTGETWYEWTHDLTDTPVWLFRSMKTYPFYVQQREEVVLVRDNGTAEPYYRTNEFKQVATFYRRLYQEGLEHPDVLSLPPEARSQTVNQQGKFLFGASTGGYNDLPAVRRSDPNAVETDFVFNPSQPFYVNLAVLNYNGVPSTTKNPEAAIKFLAWLYGNKANHDLFIYGVEGKHYRAVGANQLQSVLDANGVPVYSHPSWQIAWAPFTRYEVGTPPEMIKQWTTPLDPSRTRPGVALGFTFKTDPVNTEYTNILALRQELLYPIKFGVVDYDKYFAELDQRMRSAGIDRVVAEFQKQLRAWMAGKK